MSHNASPSYSLGINTRSTYDVIEAICDDLTQNGFTIIERDDFSFLDRMVVTLEGTYGDKNDAYVIMDVHCNAKHGAIDGVCCILDDEEETGGVTKTYNLKELCDKYKSTFGSCEPSAIANDIVVFLENNL